MKQKICILGLGYIGLPSAALLASRGYQIHGVDVVETVVNTINKGEIHIIEPDLDEFVRAAVNSGNLIASTKPDFADIFIISVPTPFKEGHVPNMDYVVSASKSIAEFLTAGNTIILESTSPVGSTELVRDTLKQEGVDVSSLYIAHCPERVLPGKIMMELTANDRIVGGIDQKSTQKVADFYREFVSGEVLETDCRTAELAKLVENSSRDVQIAFANELSIVCDKLNINVWNVIKLANRHPRVNILKPGTGVGGHCIAVDPWFIINSAPDESVLIRESRMRNLYKTEWVIEKVKNRSLEWKIKYGKPPRIACMGLAFKPNIDDLRESPALHVAKKLKENGEDLVCVEPNIKHSSEFELVDYDTVNNTADIFIFLVAHKEFADLKFDPEKCLDFCGVMKQ